MTVFWYVAPCNLAEIDPTFQRCCFLIRAMEYTAQRPRRQPSSYSSPWEPEMLLSCVVVSVHVSSLRFQYFRVGAASGTVGSVAQVSPCRIVSDVFYVNKIWQKSLELRLRLCILWKVVLLYHLVHICRTSNWVRACTKMECKQFKYWVSIPTYVPAETSLKLCRSLAYTWQSSRVCCLTVSLLSLCRYNRKHGVRHMKVMEYLFEAGKESHETTKTK
jgi:hypothetical protein